MIKLKQIFKNRFPGLYSVLSIYLLKFKHQRWFGLPKLNILLFGLTLYTTYSINGPWYSMFIMTILLSHELGHFFMCKKYGVSATLPYFLPVPIPPFGTFGAVIKMRGQIPSKKALFDIGAAGPIAGLVFAIPAIIIGLCLSEVVPTNNLQWLQLGEPILFSAMSKLIIGSVPEGYDIILHPIAFAGWAGLFVTALNLLPIGQLDGGHILYAILGEKSKIIYRIGIVIFCLVAGLVYHGWIVFAILLLLFGFRHPAPSDAITELDKKRKIIGIVLFILFFLSFTPVPIKL